MSILLVVLANKPSIYACSIKFPLHFVPVKNTEAFTNLVCKGLGNIGLC